MRIKIYFALSFLTFYKDLSLVHGKSVDVSAVDESIERQFENYMNCAKRMNSSECLEITGRKRKGSENAGNNVVIIGGGASHEHGSFDDGYFVEIEDDGDRGGKKGKRRGKKKNKGSKKKKMYKKFKPLLYGMGGLKVLFDHFLLKKLAFVSLFTFILSKISFILATLVALKQFFHTPTSHQRAESHKVEVIHIPIRKYKPKNHHEHDFDESKLIPVTYSPDSLIPDTTPSYFSFSSPSDFISSEENFSDTFNSENDNKLLNSQDDDDLMTDNFDRSDKFKNEKNYYLNHVHSPFV